MASSLKWRVGSTSSQCPKTIFDYLTVLSQNQSETQGVADFARGKALNYATATEIHTLSQYTETTLGKLRKRMDRALSTVVQTLYAGSLRYVR